MFCSVVLKWSVVNSGRTTIDKLKGETHMSPFQAKVTAVREVFGGDPNPTLTLILTLTLTYKINP